MGRNLIKNHQRQDLRRARNLNNFQQGPTLYGGPKTLQNLTFANRCNGPLLLAIGGPSGPLCSGDPRLALGGLWAGRFAPVKLATGAARFGFQAARLTLAGSGCADHAAGCVVVRDPLGNAGVVPIKGRLFQAVPR